MRVSLISEWPKSTEALARSKKSLAGGVSSGMRASMQPQPLFFDRGLGSQLWDVDGNQYTDYVLGWGPVLVGHSHPRVVEAVTAQLAKGQTFGAGHHLEYTVAEKFLAMSPGAERVRWSNTGTDADQIALRFARAFTGRQHVLKFAGHYHGWHDSVLISYRGEGVADGGAPILGSRGQSKAAISDMRIARWNDIDSVKAILLNPDNEVAAVVAEPVLCNSGVIEASPGFLEELRELCTATGTVLIFDEVITGFRMALGGTVESTGITPDLAVYAKAMAGGFSLAAVAGRADILDQIDQGVVHSGTYNGNPIVLAAANAVLDILTETNPYRAMSQKAEALAEGLTKSLAAHGIVGSAHNVGPLLQVALGVTEVTTLEQYLAADWGLYDRLSAELVRRGQFVMPGGRWFLSTEHTDEDIQGSVAAFDAAIAAVSAYAVA